MVREQKALRIMQVVFVVFALLLFPQMRYLTPAQPPGPLTLFHKLVALIAIADCVIGIVLQRILIKNPGESLPIGTVATPSQRWLIANVVRLAFSLSTCLFGLVIHMTGSPNWLAQGLVGLGILFMVVVAPGKPPADEQGNSPYGAIG
jgi:hypothetical protein